MRLRRHRLSLLATMYVAGIVIWTLLYYYFRAEFVVNPEVLKVEEYTIRTHGQSLILTIEAAFQERGISLSIDEPDAWIVSEQDGEPSIILPYRLQLTAHRELEQDDGTLVVTAASLDAHHSLVRPADATKGTESFVVSFPFERFARLVTRGYDSKTMSVLGACYFSVSTITTLGLGDIIPKSDRARFLVVTQVAYGLIVFALLCNAIVVRFGGEQTTSSASPNAG